LGLRYKVSIRHSKTGNQNTNPHSFFTNFIYLKKNYSAFTPNRGPTQTQLDVCPYVSSVTCGSRWTPARMSKRYPFPTLPLFAFALCPIRLRNTSIAPARRRRTLSRRRPQPYSPPSPCSVRGFEFLRGERIRPRSAGPEVFLDGEDARPASTSPRRGVRPQPLALLCCTALLSCCLL
jgi:hypothetical protein